MSICICIRAAAALCLIIIIINISVLCWSCTFHFSIFIIIFLFWGFFLGNTCNVIVNLSSRIDSRVFCPLYFLPCWWLLFYYYLYFYCIVFLWGRKVWLARFNVATFGRFNLTENDTFNCFWNYSIMVIKHNLLSL